MPELPEVETLRRGLERGLVGHTFVDARVLVPKMLKGSVTDPTVWRQKIQGSRLESVTRRGKHLIFALASGYYLLLHLNMRGQLLITPHTEPDAKYLAVALTTEDDRDLRFHDMWTWGEMRLVTEEELDLHSALQKMGPEPFSVLWTSDVFADYLRKKPRGTIKATLLNQEIVAGIGNIYADEALFRSGVHSLRQAGSLSPIEIERLHREIRCVLTEATEAGGTTSDNYVDAAGSVGRYTPRVYDRAGEPCLVCGTTLERIKVVGRGTVFCPTCQT